MDFYELSEILEKLETTTSRNAMVEILSGLFIKTGDSDIAEVTYLLQGRVAPLFEAVEFGMADKMVMKALSQAYGIDEKEAATEFKRVGDIGILGQALAQKAGQKRSNVTVKSVFETLREIARSSGEGSVERKVGILSDLFKSLDPLAVRFVARIPVGKLRLGFSDMTVLEAYSWMLSGSKKQKPEIESAYNIRPDLGFIAKTLKENGMEGLAHIKPKVFTPILMARAERLSSGEEILKKIGTCAVEPKFDGFRLQIHFNGNHVKLFTRNLEDSTYMYPDVVESVKAQIDVSNAIFEGEAIAYDPDTGEYLPFQETVQRKRKYGIEDMAKTIPLKLITFDLLYINGESILHEPYIKRRKKLEGMIRKGNGLLISQERTVSSAKEIEYEFDDAVTRGLEGIVAKKLDGTYQAGARGWNWIKFKRSYAGDLEDTIDAVVMGYYFGRGKRTGFGIGAFLIGVYDEKQDEFETIAKIGTGLTDDEWRELKIRCEKLKTNEKPPLYNVDKNLFPDVWVEGSIVVEIRADEISRSPIHTAGRVMKSSKSGTAFNVDIPGYALRFPRLERFRDDRKPEDATTLKEVEEMFSLQGKKKV